MSTAPSNEVIYTYGGWRLPRAAGLGKFSFAQTMALMAAETSRRYFSPVGVRVTPLPLRINSFLPIQDSREAI